MLTSVYASGLGSCISEVARSEE